MFTGLIEETGKLTKLEKTPQGAILTIECKIIPEDIKIGSSVSINGACHTVIEYTKNTITVQTSNETLKVSNFSLLKIADIVNLERAITLNSRLDGHIVTGHIDGTAEFLQKTNDGFKVSEEDFKLRGGGDIFGIRQSGDMNFKLADIKNDYDLLLRAKEDSEAFMKSEEYQSPKYAFIKKEITKATDLD